jgi:hypothetical protein
MVMILDRHIEAWFMQRDKKPGIYHFNNIMRGGIRFVITSASCSYCANTEKCYFWR